MRLVLWVGVYKSINNLQESGLQCLLKVLPVCRLTNAIMRIGKAIGNFAVTAASIHHQTLCGDDTLEISGGAYF